MTTITAVLDFWLDEAGPEKWFVKDDSLDRAVADRFGAAYERAAAYMRDDYETALREFRPLAEQGNCVFAVLLDQEVGAAVDVDPIHTGMIAQNGLGKKKPKRYSVFFQQISEKVWLIKKYG